jgi:hypothetical protein
VFEGYDSGGWTLRVLVVLPHPLPIRCCSVCGWGRLPVGDVGQKFFFSKHNSLEGMNSSDLQVLP